MSGWDARANSLAAKIRRLPLPLMRAVSEVLLAEIRERKATEAREQQALLNHDLVAAISACGLDDHPSSLQVALGGGSASESRFNPNVSSAAAAVLARCQRRQIQSFVAERTSRICDPRLLSSVVDSMISQHLQRDFGARRDPVRGFLFALLSVFAPSPATVLFRCCSARADSAIRRSALRGAETGARPKTGARPHPRRQQQCTVRYATATGAQGAAPRPPRRLQWRPRLLAAARLGLNLGANLRAARWRAAVRTRLPLLPVLVLPPADLGTAAGAGWGWAAQS